MTVCRMQINLLNCSFIFQSSCIFPAVNKLLRRIAYTETIDGRATIPEGGIWNIDKSMYEETIKPQSKLSSAISEIKTKFNIDFMSTTWKDMKKPLFSALGARLYLMLKGNSDDNIPRDIESQAAYWKRFFNVNGDKDTFIEESKKLEKNCKGKAVDLVFVTDTSGSVKGINYRLMLGFIRDTVSFFDVSPKLTRVSVVAYGSDVYNDIDLNNTFNKTELLEAIVALPYRPGSTYTDLALESIRMTSFTEARGARPLSEGIPRVAVVLTDGRSHSESKTVYEAELCHKARITMYAVGIGSNLRGSELEAIASSPKCVNNIKLRAFSDMKYLAEQIQQSSCEAPVILDTARGSDNTDTEIQLPPGFSQNCKISVNSVGSTINLNATSGGVAYYTSKENFPNEAYYDQKIVSSPGSPKALYIENTSSKEETVYCRIVGELYETTDLHLGVWPGNKDHCASNPCLNGTCANYGDAGYRCHIEVCYIKQVCNVIDTNTHVYTRLHPPTPIHTIIYIR